MGRVKDNIKIKGKNYWSLFDTGSRNCYVISEVAKGLLIQKLPVEFKVALGGNTHNLNKTVSLFAEIQNKPIHFEAYIIDYLGRDEQGKKIQILFGALAMQKWGIEANVKKEQIDLTHYSKEFLEF